MATKEKQQLSFAYLTLYVLAVLYKEVHQCASRKVSRCQSRIVDLKNLCTLLSTVVDNF
jgi:hypothetical protein